MQRYKNIFWRQYVVDKHGVSLSKYDLTWGILPFKSEGYFYDSIGNITKKIPILLGDYYSQDKISDTLHLYLFGAGTIGNYDEPQNYIDYNDGLLCYPQDVDSLLLDRIENTEVGRNPENIVKKARKQWNGDKRVFHRKIMENADE